MTGLATVALIAVLLLGVPHGGLDGAVARRVGWPTGWRAWLSFHAAYVALSALVVVCWWVWPALSLGLFLLISAVHFGASDIAESGAEWLPWIAHGGLVCIAIPSLQPDLVAPIFTTLVGPESIPMLMDIVTSLFPLWVLSCVAYCVYAYRNKQYRQSLLSLMVLIGLVYVLPPLVSFAFYFCFWHSPGHIRRLWRSLDKAERSRSLGEAFVYTLLAWVSVAIAFLYLNSGATESSIQITFIGLAALTLPHMLLVDYADRANESGAPG